MVHAVDEEGVYGLVRRAFSSLNSPQLSYLIPHADSSCLFYINSFLVSVYFKLKIGNFNQNLTPYEKRVNISYYIGEMNRIVSNTKKRKK